MFKFGEKHPVLFEIILFIISLIAAGVFVGVGSAADVDSDLSSSVGRILVAVILFVIYRRAFQTNGSDGKLVYVLPALLFPVWNLFYNLSSGMQFGGVSYFSKGAVTALAPALFEEVIFRGIFIYNLKKKGHGDVACLLISSAVFSAVHLTNIVGLDPLSVALQVVYSFVIGLVYGAIYLKNGRIAEVILAHFLTDFTNRIYLEQPSTSSVVQLVIFGVILAAETAYAVWLTAKKK